MSILTPEEVATAIGRQKDMLIEMQQQFIAHQQQQILKDNRITEELKAIRDLVSQAKGGWKVAMVFGSVSTVAVGGLAWLWSQFTHTLK